MSSFDRIMEMVRAKNIPAYPLVPSEVSLDNPAIDASSTHNTRVTMRAQAGSDYTGQVDLFYTRVSLTLLGVLELVQEQPFTYQDVLGIINQRKVAQMTPDDFTLSDIPVMETGVVTPFTLSAKDSSLVWLGNTQVTLLTGIPNEASGLSTFLNNDAAALFA